MRFNWSRTKTGVTVRGSHRRCSIRKGVLKNFTKFSGKHLCQSFFFNKVASLMARRPLTVLEWNPSTGFSLWILWNFQESFFAEHILATTCDIMLFFFFFADHWGLQTKINLFGGAIRNSQPHPILSGYGNQAEKSLSSCGHTCTDLDIPIAGKVEEKEELIVSGVVWSNPLIFLSH